MPTIAVLGPGGVGGLVAAALARSGADIVVVAREPTARLIAREGIAVRSIALGDFNVRPATVATLDWPVDHLLVATKAAGLESALRRVQTEPGLVVPLLNGLEHMETLRARFGSVAAGVIRVESDRPVAAGIVQTSRSVRIDLATEVPGLQRLLTQVADALTSGGIDVRVGTSERQVLWSKLARLNALALTTSASDQPIGFIRTDPRWRDALARTISETVAVGDGDGATLDAAATLDELDRAHPELGSSMRRDIAAGREPELDAIAGAVLRAGARHGLRCPTVERLAAEVAERAGIRAPQSGGRIGSGPST